MEESNIPKLRRSLSACAAALAARRMALLVEKIREYIHACRKSEKIMQAAIRNGKTLARKDERTAQHIQVALIQLPCAGEQRDEQAEVEVHGCVRSAQTNGVGFERLVNWRGGGVPLILFSSFCFPPFVARCVARLLPLGAGSSDRPTGQPQPPVGPPDMSQPEPSVVAPEIGGGGESVAGEAPLTPRSRASFKDLRRLNSMSSPKAVVSPRPAAAPVAAAAAAAAAAPAPAAASDAPVAVASVTVAIATETDKPTVAVMEPTPAAAVAVAAAASVASAQPAAAAAQKPAAAPAPQAQAQAQAQAKSPEEEASWLSQATWWWMTPLLQLGTERPYVIV